MRSCDNYSHLLAAMNKIHHLSLRALVVQLHLLAFLLVVALLPLMSDSFVGIAPPARTSVTSSFEGIIRMRQDFILYYSLEHSTRRRRGNPRRSITALAAMAKKRGTSPSSSSSGFGFGSSGKSHQSSSSSTGTTSLEARTPKTRSLSAGRASGAGMKVLRKAANAFDAIRRTYGVTAVRDVYVRSPLNSPTTYWFVGKIASSTASQTTHGTVAGDDYYNSGQNDYETDTDVDEQHFQWAALAQKRLIFEYAKNELRPQNLGGPKYSPTLELWLAPGNTEMDVVQNKVNLVRVLGSASDLPSDLDLSTIGYNPEIYVGEERVKGGLRVERDEHGKPTKPVFEITQSREPEQAPVVDDDGVNL